jgi:hypothetical protein
MKGGVFVNTKNKNSLIITAVLVLSSFLLYSYHSIANSVFTVSTSATISESIVYIQTNNQAKSTITINAQVMKNGSNYTGEVDFWEVSIWRINQDDQPIHSGFQETVKIQSTSPTLEYQRDIFTPVDFLGGAQQRRQRFAYRVMVHLKDQFIQTIGDIESDAIDLESTTEIHNASFDYDTQSLEIITEIHNASFETDIINVTNID